jgi:tRNA/rRNA methyltransferase
MTQFELSVVLVRSLYDSNIGATSRAMANMGFSRLILIDPKCEITYTAQQAAATGQFALQNRITYKSWDEFYKAEAYGIYISLSARDGRGRQVQDLSETLSKIKNENSDDEFDSEIRTKQPLYLIFGPEDWGLSAEDIALSNFVCSIPTYGENSSLNLAQAVLVALFIVRQVIGGDRTILDGQIRTKKSGDLKVFPEETLKTWLMEMGFDLSKPKTNVFTVLRKLLLKNTPTEKELSTLEIVLQQSIRKLKEYNELRKKN